MARPKAFDRERVLEKAMCFFWCHGYEATSIQDLVDHLGINRQSLYDTFGDKHALFLASLNRYKEVKVAQLVMQLQHPGAGKAAIQDLFQNVVKELLSNEPRRGCLMANSSAEVAPHDPESARLVSAYLGQMEDAFYHALVSAREQGAFHDPNRDLYALSRFLTNSLQGLSVTSKAGASYQALQDIVTVTLSVLA